MSVNLIGEDRIKLNFLNEFNPHLALVDTGASNSCLSKQTVEQSPYLKQLPRQYYRNNSNTAQLADGRYVKQLYQLHAELVIAGRRIRQTFNVSQNLPSKIILGQDFLSRQKVVISYISEKVYPNLDPHFSAYTDYRLEPNKSSIITVTIPSYIKVKQLVTLEPSIPGVHVVDSLIQPKYSGKYQKARIFVINNSGKPQYIHKNQSTRHDRFCTR